MSAKRIVVPTTGGTSDADPLTVNLPTFRVIRYSQDNRLALVEVPDDVLPDDIDTGGITFALGGDDGIDVRRMRALMRVRWASYLDRVYQEKAGIFRPLG